MKTVDCACLSSTYTMPYQNSLWLTYCVFLTLLNANPMFIWLYLAFSQGSETDIRAKFYSMAFQQHYDEDDGHVTWRIVDYEFAGDMPYF